MEKEHETEDSRPRFVIATEGLCGPQAETNILTIDNMNLNAWDFGHMGKKMFIFVFPYPPHVSSKRFVFL